jgi:hypothetical protein
VVVVAVDVAAAGAEPQATHQPDRCAG